MSFELPGSGDGLIEPLSRRYPDVGCCFEVAKEVCVELFNGFSLLGLRVGAAWLPRSGSSNDDIIAKKALMGQVMENLLSFLREVRVTRSEYQQKCTKCIKLLESKDFNLAVPKHAKPAIKVLMASLLRLPLEDYLSYDYRHISEDLECLDIDQIVRVLADVDKWAVSIPGAIATLQAGRTSRRQRRTRLPTLALNKGSLVYPASSGLHKR